jgi:hypothetical protein
MWRIGGRLLWGYYAITLPASPLRSSRCEAEEKSQKAQRSSDEETCPRWEFVSVVLCTMTEWDVLGWRCRGVT